MPETHETVYFEKLFTAILTPGLTTSVPSDHKSVNDKVLSSTEC